MLSNMTTHFKQLNSNADNCSLDELKQSVSLVDEFGLSKDCIDALETQDTKLLTQTNCNNTRCETIRDKDEFRILFFGMHANRNGQI